MKTKSAFPTTEVSFSNDITPTLLASEDHSHLLNHSQLNLVQPKRPSVPRTSDTDDRLLRQNLIGKVANLLHSTISRSRENSVSSNASNSSLPRVTSPTSDRFPALGILTPSRPRLRMVKETNFVSLEYDPISRRKVLNTYEIRGEIGRGEHGKVKLARDLHSGELVAIKIVNRKNKKERYLLSNRGSIAAPNHPYSDYETKIRREIAIMKRCDHKYIVNLKEVLDDRRSHKIYLVLEYLEKGEIKWKRLSPIQTPMPLHDSQESNIPCCDSNTHMKTEASPLDDNELLADIYSPNLTFRQSRKVFRDVLLGLEYLHMQGIIHRDIKPANLLVGSDNTVKISDFGVSFASYLGNTGEGFRMSEAELAKTVGTPAFFAPELCRTSHSASNSTIKMTSLDMDKLSSQQNGTETPKVTYKIDIWALGVTLYCLLFGKVPFNAELEFALFDVIVNQEVQFPQSKDEFHSPQEVSDEEFELAKDLVRKLLDKNSETRLTIRGIKEHPFVLMDLEDDLDKLNEFFFINSTEPYGPFDSIGKNHEIGKDELDDAVVGVGARIQGSFLQAIRSRDPEALRKAALKMETSTSSSDESSNFVTRTNSNTFGYNPSINNSLILLESVQTPPMGASRAHLQTNDTGSFLKSVTGHTGNHTPELSTLSRQNTGSRPSVVLSRNNLLFQDVLETNSSSSSRQGSVSGILEAPQIETKRNVGGDLYLKNESVIDTFKGIQQLDQKRRKSSAFVRNNSSPSSPRPSKTESTLGLESKHPLSQPQAIPMSSDSSVLSKIKVGPISIDNKRRASSVISLPLTESFASLDSFNDDYLTHKYHEYRKKKLGSKLPEPGAVNSDPNLGDNAFNTINEKFKNFNLGSLMTASKNAKEGRTNEGVAPNSRSRFLSYSTETKSLASQSYSSCSTSGSGSSDSESDEEAGNLTLKFSSKVTPRSRPPFLSLKDRAHSHDSNLPNLINHQNNAYDVPVVFQGDLLEFEDVPENLMGNVQKAADTDMSASVSIISQNSIATITNGSDEQPSLLRVPHKPSVQHSPLRNQVDVDSQSNGSPRQERDPQSRVNDAILGVAKSALRSGYFRNHYKKEPMHSPFPKSKHLDNDKESVVKSQMREGTEHIRPCYQRSNSVTLGLLQHTRPDPT